MPLWPLMMRPVAPEKATGVAEFNRPWPVRPVDDSFTDSHDVRANSTDEGSGLHWFHRTLHEKIKTTVFLIDVRIRQDRP